MSRRALASALVATAVLAACADDDTPESATARASEAASPTSAADTTLPPQDDAPTSTEVDASEENAPEETPEETHDGGDHSSGSEGELDVEQLHQAYLGAAPYQDVEAAEADGWVGTIDALGCFERPGHGGMGVHWLNESLLDDRLDPAMPEALVYELDLDGDVVGLVAHEYLVPLDAWTSDDPPTLFGRDFHPHPVLPFWILHVYLWKDNPAGLFTDWNPAVRMCPDGVPVFGEDDAA